MTTEACMQLLICCTVLLAFAAPAVAASGHEWTAVLSTAPAPAPTPPTLTWDVEYILWAPDCQQQAMIGINGKFPGPTIRARAGDLISITVNNKLHTEGLVIHWHGLRQFGTPWADGTASISQCAINPGEAFTYNFTADKPGTYFYHGHFGMQRAAGLYGSLIVDATEEQPEPYKYDDELSMLLSDWYHEDVNAQAAGLDRKEKHFQWIGEPQTILINGRGHYECMLGAVRRYHRNIDKYAKTCVRGKEKKLCTDEERCLRRSECGPYCPESQCAPVIFDVDPDKTYRLRIASTTSLSALNVQIEGHELEVVEADGNPVKPFTVKDIDIYSGESYSVLLKTNKTPGSYWTSVGVRGRRPETLPAAAILNYANSRSKWPALYSTPPETPAWDNVTRSKEFTYRIKSLQNADKTLLTKKAFRTIAMLNTQNLVDGHIKWSVNNISLTLPATPYLGAYYYGLQDTAFDASVEAPDSFPDEYDVKKTPMDNKYPTEHSNRVYKLRYGDVIDVVLQNAYMRNNNSEIHPWHLHGHDFWVLGYGEGRYDSRDAKLNTVDPPLRNTVVVFPHGWTAIRFVANNTGAWAFHCHIEPHLHMGMGAVFVEGIEKMHELDVPKDAMMCGVVRTAATHVSPAMPISPAPAISP